MSQSNANGEEEELTIDDYYNELLQSSRYGEIDNVQGIVEYLAESDEKLKAVDLSDCGDDSDKRKKKLCEIVVNFKDNLTGSTALHYASANGEEKVVEMLLSYGADCSICNSSGNTPLHWAVQNRHKNVVKLLLNHPNADVLAINANSKKSSLTYAYETMDQQLIDVLLDHKSAEKLEEEAKPSQDGEDDNSEEQGEASTKNKENGGNSIEEGENAEKVKSGDIGDEGQEKADDTYEFLQEGSENQEKQGDEKPLIEKKVFGLVFPRKSKSNKSLIENGPTVFVQEIGIKKKSTVEQVLDTTGAFVWGSSIILAQWICDLEKDNFFKNKRVVEIGCGCALPATTCFRYTQASEILVTDMKSDVWQNTIENVKLNVRALAKATKKKEKQIKGNASASAAASSSASAQAASSTNSTSEATSTKRHPKISTHVLDWRHKSTYPRDWCGSTDVIIGADLSYEPLVVDAMLATVDALLSKRKDSVFLYVSPLDDRAGLDAMLKKFAQAGFRINKQSPPDRFLRNPLADPDDKEATASLIICSNLLDNEQVLYTFKRA